MKNETIEEAGLKHCNMLDKFPALVNPLFSFNVGAKWQQERSYSEQDMIDFAYKYTDERRDKEARAMTPELLIKQFKKK